MKMLFKRKQVLCTSCGFLCWQQLQPLANEREERVQIYETNIYGRQRLQAGDSTAYSETKENGYMGRLCCIRKQWVMLPTREKEVGYYSNVGDVIKPRQCPYYIKYQPGFSAEEHKELKREQETRRVMVKATLLGAAIGGSVAIIAQMLYMLFTPSP